MGKSEWSPETTYSAHCTMDWRGYESHLYDTQILTHGTRHKFRAFCCCCFKLYTINTLSRNLKNFPTIHTYLPALFLAKNKQTKKTQKKNLMTIKLSQELPVHAQSKHRAQTPDNKGHETELGIVLINRNSLQCYHRK